MASATRIERSRSIDGSTFSAVNDTPSFAVKHYSVAEIATLWGLSDDAVRKIFGKEPGVLVIGDEKPHGHKRRYSTLRIPEFVVERVHRRLSKV
jgi:hypothetical protein